MTTPKCKHCKGKGKLLKMDAHNQECSYCEGSGIKLSSKMDETFNDYLEFTKSKIYYDDKNFIDLDDD